MSKYYRIKRKEFNKINSAAEKIFNLLFVSVHFGNEYVKNICETECIMTPLEKAKDEADKLVCMLLYLETKDEELKNVFSR